MRVSIILLAGVGLITGCASNSTLNGELRELDSATAPLADYQKALPNAPELALYQYRLQKRIDRAVFEELRAWHFSGGSAPGSQHSFRILVVVLADGRLGADDEDLKRSTREEPVLTGVALRALASITDHPEPFPPGLIKEVGHSFRYQARFTQL